MIKSRSNFNRICVGVLNRLVDKLNSQNNANITQNGELEFLNNILTYFSKYNQDLIVFDIDANIGEYTELIHQSLVSKINNFCIYTFEPVASTYKLLEKRCSGLSNVRLFQLGVSSAESEAVIYKDQESSTLASLYQRDVSEYDIKMNQKEKIHLIRLDKFFIENNITVIDFLKIDIEGHELSAFEGMGDFLTPDKIRCIQFEYGGANIDSRTYLRDFVYQFTSKGYTIYKIKRASLEPFVYSARKENFQYTNFVAMDSKINF
jgi:FkbM family methyltransferase